MKKSEEAEYHKARTIKALNLMTSTIHNVDIRRTCRSYKKSIYYMYRNTPWMTGQHLKVIYNYFGTTSNTNIDDVSNIIDACNATLKKMQKEEDDFKEIKQIT